MDRRGALALAIAGTVFLVVSVGAIFGLFSPRWPQWFSGVLLVTSLIKVFVGGRALLEPQ